MTKTPEVDLASLMTVGGKLVMTDPRFAVGEAEIRGNRYRVFTSIPDNLGDFFTQTFAAGGDREFLVYEDERLTFTQVYDRARALAAALRALHGVSAGQHVAIAMRNYPEWIISYVALHLLDAVVVPLNAWWRSEELRYGLLDSDAKLVIADAKRFDYLAAVKDELGLTLIVARDERPEADGSVSALIAEALSLDAGPAAAPDARCSIVYTSGSTGQPKGVILTHRGVLSALYSWNLIKETFDAALGEPLMGENPSILLAVPLFHVTGSHSIFLMSLLIGRRIVMMKRWDADEAAALIRKERLTNFVGVPSQSYDLIAAAGEDGLPSLVDLGSGGAKRPPDQVEKIAEAFAQATASSGYGLSETNALGCVISKHFYRDRPGSTGRAVPPLTDIKIVKDGDDQPPGEVGEIWIRSPANFEGYLGRPDDTKAALTEDGWMRTGDLGKLDEEGFLYIVDRLKELIIRGGENISTLEVEAGAYEHGMVGEAAAFAVPDDRLGEIVGLVVYPKEGAALEASDLHDFMSERMAGFKVPERIWIAPAPLPRLGTEKFDKMTVKKIAMQHPPALAA